MSRPGGTGGAPRRRVVAVLGLLLGVLVSARAEEKGRPPKEIRMQEVEIEGEVERPGVFYVIPRRATPLDLGPRSRDFRPEILEPLLPEGRERGGPGG